MNCQECRDQMAAYLEGLLDETGRRGMEGHLAECTACQTELNEVRELTVRLAGDGVARSPVSLEGVVMDRILYEQAREIRRLRMRKRVRVLGISGAMATAVTLLLVSGLWLTQPAAAEAERAAKVLAQGAEAVPSASTAHIVANMRTLPHDNFSLIGAEFPFVPVEVWMQLGDKPKWRVQKPLRVAVMDGESTVMLIRDQVGAWIPRATEGAFDTGWILGLAKVQDMITRELRAALARGWDLKLTHTTTPAGAEQLVVTVEAKAEPPESWKNRLPNFSQIKNRFFEFSDMRRVYRFDAKSQRLEGMEAYLHRPDGDALIFEINRIEYDQPIDPALFSLNVPDNVQWLDVAEPLPDNAKYEALSPQQAAQAFLDACAKQDWNEAQKFASGPISQGTKKFLGGLQIIRLGEPFQWKPGAEWLVPLEIKLKDGTGRKQNLRIRKDNRAKRCLITDGGFSLTQPAEEQKAMEALSRLAQSGAEASTVHVVAKMRTQPDGNFGSIDADGELVPVEIWRQSGLLPRSRVEKPGRVIVVNGFSTVALIRSGNLAIRLPFPTDGALDSYPLLRLTRAKDMIANELRGVQAEGWPLEVTKESTPAGEKKIVVTVKAKAGLSDNDIVKNTFFDKSDMRRVYRFDAKSERLESVEGYLQQPDGDLLVLATERIEYDQPIDPAVFTLKLPEDVQWYKAPGPLPDNEKYAKLTPAQAARAFFEACATENWEEAQKFWWMPTMGKDPRELLGGLQIVRLGEPFQSKGWHGWFVPYEVKLKNGTASKGDLALRNDTPANRYLVDGGLAK